MTHEDPTQESPGTRWVFGYGSLIWRPGFRHVRAVPARLYGVHRSLCIRSYHYRGTDQVPGLVFGLRRGGSCAGMGFEIAPEDWIEVRDYLRERELVTDVYLEVWRPMRLSGGETVSAMTYVADPRHEQFAGVLSVAEQLDTVVHAAGTAGHNRDYVLNTIAHLREMGFADRNLVDLENRLAALPDLAERDSRGGDGSVTPRCAS